MIVKLNVPDSGPWHPLQVFSDAWKRASGLLIPGPFHWIWLLNTEPAWNWRPSNCGRTVFPAAPGSSAMIAASFWFTKSEKT